MKNLSLVLMLFFVAAFSTNTLQAQSPACCDIQSCCKVSSKKDNTTASAYQVVKASNKSEVAKTEAKSACCASTSCPFNICQIFCGSGKTVQQENSKASCSGKLTAMRKE